MKVSNVESIEFKVKTKSHTTKWGYGKYGDEHDEVQGNS